MNLYHMPITSSVILKMLAKKRKYIKQFYPHCSCNVSKSTWYEHYSKYFNTSSNQWEKSAGSGSQFNFNLACDQELTTNTTNRTSEGNYDEQIHDTSGFMISDIEGETGRVESRSTGPIVD